MQELSKKLALTKGIIRPYNFLTGTINLRARSSERYKRNTPLSKPLEKHNHETILHNSLPRLTLAPFSNYRIHYYRFD